MLNVEILLVMTDDENIYLHSEMISKEFMFFFQSFVYFTWVYYVSMFVLT